jgi:hypothetical protein
VTASSSTQAPEASATRFALSLAGAVLVTRVALLGLLGAAVHGREFTDDAKVHLQLVRHPLDVFTGRLGGNGFSPLLGPLESVFGYPLQLVVSDFYAIRGVYIAYDVITAFFVGLTLCALKMRPDVRRWAAVGYLVLPASWMMIVMAQEEGLVACFLAATLWLVATGRLRTALVICGVGVAATKVFLLLPLTALVLLLRSGSLRSRAVAALLPAIAVYGLSLVVVLARSRTLPLLQFTPPSRFGVNAWTFANVEWGLRDELAKRISTPLALLGALVPLAVLCRRRIEVAVPDLARACAVTLLWLFVLFYCVEPEYYVYLLPPLLLLVRSWRDLVPLAVVFSAPWAVNFTSGVLRAEGNGAGGGRRAFVQVAQHLHLPLHASFQVALWTTIVTSLALTAKLTRESLRALPDPAAK